MNNDSSADTDDAQRFAYLAEGNAAQARKRVAVKLIIRDTSGRVLLVNPTYKDYWDLPGGMAEANEAPTAAAIRELEEELDHTPRVGSLLQVEWVAARGPWDDQLVLTFDGGTLNPEQAQALRVADSELSEYGFYPLPDARAMLRPDIAAQLSNACRALDIDRTYYHEQHL